MAEIRVPTLGESVTEATIGRWFKQAGEAIAADEPVVELETDKVTVEVPAPAAGRLAEIAAKEGETVGLGALLGVIEAGAAASAPAAVQPAAPVSQPDGGKPAEPKAANGVESTRVVAHGATEGSSDAGPIEPRAMPPAPSAAKLMAEHNL